MPSLADPGGGVFLHLVSRNYMVACYLAELRFPTDESHHVRNKEQKVPLGLSGRWVVM